MEIINLTRQQLYKSQINTSFAFNLQYLKEIWIFNCCQGCQHQLGKRHIKISQISKIIITDLNIKNISGLLGLLSSLSLINRKKELHIYSPRGLNIYLELGIKYSQTNFRYNLYFHTLKTGLIIQNNLYQVYTFANHFQFEFFIIFQEKFGKFKLNKAQNFNLKEGPLYGKLKKGYHLILPDGLILDGTNFTAQNKPGNKIFITTDQYNKRNSLEIGIKCSIIQNLL